MVIISGTGRSGTSIVTRILYDALDLSDFDYDTDAPPYAGMEWGEISELNNDIRDGLGGYPQSRQHAFDAAMHYRIEILDKVQRYPCIIKDPRFAWVLPVWLYCVQVDGAIVCVRNIHDVVASANNTDTMGNATMEGAASRLGYLIATLEEAQIPYVTIRFPQVVRDVNELLRAQRVVDVDADVLRVAHDKYADEGLVHYGN